MTRFEEIGVEIQYGATSKRKAQGSFRYSCNVCCNRGMHIDCDRCAIACAHKTVVESFEALEALAKVHASPAMACRKFEPCSCHIPGRVFRDEP